MVRHRLLRGSSFGSSTDVWWWHQTRHSDFLFFAISTDFSITENNARRRPRRTMCIGLLCSEKLHEISEQCKIASLDAACVVGVCPFFVGTRSADVMTMRKVVVVGHGPLSFPNYHFPFCVLLPCPCQSTYLVLRWCDMSLECAPVVSTLDPRSLRMPREFGQPWRGDRTHLFARRLMSRATDVKSGITCIPVLVVPCRVSCRLSVSVVLSRKGIEVTRSVWLLFMFVRLVLRSRVMCGFHGLCGHVL